MLTELQQYFNNDLLSANVWFDKYCLKDQNGIAQEITPTDMHWRLAKEFARIEAEYRAKEAQKIGKDTKLIGALSEFGRGLYYKRLNHNSIKDIEQEFFNYFDKFNQIVPQGSIMSNLGNFFIYGSLSNCFGISSPYDSYGGIIRTDEQLAQLMKRRGGVGVNISTIRNSTALVTNASKTSTGVVPYAERYSNTTREVAQEGRRGALMILLLVNHPDIFKFAGSKNDRTKITGANISVMFTEEFMQALEKGEDFYCRFPVDVQFKVEMELPYNEVVQVHPKVSIMRIKPQELFDLIAEMAWKNAEPGVAFYDRVVDYSPEGVYKQYKAVVCNPCGEQWFAANETCRLIATNLWAIVKNHFETSAEIDYNLCYELFYMQQRLGDNLVDLECEYIDRILDKIISDPEPEDIKNTEYILWKDIQKIAREGRRTGGGFTALGDMLAALNLRYDSDEAIATVEKVMKTKMRAELDCTIDMAILRGSFIGWDRHKEFGDKNLPIQGKNRWGGLNSFYEMLLKEFPEQAARMYDFGRRNTNWSTVAPTGTVSLMTQTTSGLEPLFKAYYIRRKKINPSEEGSRVDFTDQSGDKWQEYAVLHPKFKEWIFKNSQSLDERDLDEIRLTTINKDTLKKWFEKSPWYKSEADDIAWEKRIEIQSVIQKYTSNAISSTINLPKDVPLDTVKGIYLAAYKAGLKGVTIYRDTSRSGVLIHETPKQTTIFDKDTIYDLYVTQKKSLGEIGKMFNKNVSSIWYQLKKHNIPVRSVKEGSNMANVNHCEITPYIKEVIEGELLGDGHLRKYPSAAQFNITSKHMEYVEWLKKTFEDNNIECSRIFTSVLKEGNTVYKLQTLAYAEILEIRNNWYDEKGKKRLPEMFTRLTPLQLRQWYIGDGSVVTTSNARYIACYTSFSKEDKVKLLEILQTQISPQVTTHENFNKFYFPATIVKDLFDLLGKCPVPCYEYKWNNFNDSIYLLEDNFKEDISKNIVSSITKTPIDEFGYVDAVKRPKELDAHYYPVTVKGKHFAVIVGLLSGLPYELFAFEGGIKDEEVKGKLVKVKTGVYSFKSSHLNIENVQLSLEHSDEKVLTRFVSQLLRHGVNPKYIIEQVDKAGVTVVSFAKAINRILKKFIPDENTTSDCPQCTNGKLIFEEGCKSCKTCGYSAC